MRQLNRQIESQFYERTALSKNKAAMLTRGAKPKPQDAITPEEQIKDPYVLEFLSLKDEYSESELEEALILHLEHFLLELGGDFTFENPPVGLILCAMKNSALAKYALQGLPNKVLAAEYKTVLPDEKLIAEELKRTRKLLEERKR